VIEDESKEEKSGRDVGNCVKVRELRGWESRCPVPPPEKSCC